MQDVYERITARILAALEAGTPPWVKPWSAVADPIPRNGASRRPYRGINALLLGMERDAAGYASNQWMTFRQAQQLGARVRKGERASTVIFFEMKPGRPVDPDDEHEARLRPVVRVFNVFNIDQIDELPAEYRAAPLDDRPWDADAQAEAILERSGAEIVHGGFRAYYSPQSDRIHLPVRGAFGSAAGYYGTALHELAHWTGHGARLDRRFGARFGDSAYAVEELVAELSAAYLCAHCRIDGSLQHAAYISSWLEVLRRDKRAVVMAAAKAQSAADYLLARVDPEQAAAAQLAA
jgi:antirestriction protein ArdC